MANVYDNLGRLVNLQNAGNLNLQQIKELIASSAKSKVGTATPYSSKTSNPEKELVNIFEKYVKNYENDIKEQKKYLKEMTNLLNEISQIRKSKEGDKVANLNNANKKSSPVSDWKNMENIALKTLKSQNKNAPKPQVWKDLDNMAKAGLKKHSLGTHDTHSELILLRMEHVLYDIERYLSIIGDNVIFLRKSFSRDKSKTAQAEKVIFESGVSEAEMTRKKAASAGGEFGGGGGGRDNGSGILGSAGGGDRRKRPSILNLFVNSNEELYELQNNLYYISNLYNGIIHDAQSNPIFSGALNEEMQFIRETRKVAYEIQGVTRDQFDLLRSFEDIDNTVMYTGKTRQDFQNRYLRTLRMGIKDLKTVQSITTSQLNTEEQLGLKAGDLGDTFVDWSRSLKLNDSQIADIGRGMRDVAKFTGISGDELNEVVKSSQKYVENLKSAGTATSQNIKNIIELSANFKKVGVNSDNLLNALSGTNKYLNADAQTFTRLTLLASRAGMQTKLMNGTFLNSKKNIKALGQAATEFLNELGLAGKTADELRANLEGLPDDLKMRINLFLGSLGIELGDAINEVEAFEESGKSLETRLQNVNEKIKNSITLEEKVAAIEDKRKLTLNASMSMLTSIQTSAKATKDMNEALDKFASKRDDFEDDLKGLGIDVELLAINQKEVAQKLIESTLKNINKGLEQVGKNKLKIDEKQISNAIKDPKAFGSLMNTIKKAEQQTAAEQKAMLDPVSQSARYLQEINENVAKFTNSTFSAIFNSTLGRMLIFLGIISSAVVSTLAILGKTILLKQIFTKTFGSILGSGIFGDFGKKINTLLIGTESAQKAAVEIAETVSTQSQIFGSLSDKLGNWFVRLQDKFLILFAKIKDLFTGFRVTIGKTMVELSDKIGPWFVKAQGFFTKHLNGLFNGFFKFLNKYMGPISIAIGGLIGWFEAESAGRTKIEGAILGALTGGAKTGSMFSSLLGIEKESAGDKALGVLGSTAYGASMGAAIGTLIAGPAGTAVGAVIGGIISGLTEIVKIFTEGTDLITGLFVDLPLLLGKSFVHGLKSVFIDFPIWLAQSWLSGLKSIFFTFPKWLMNSITEGFNYLMSIEWLSPMIAPFKEIWDITQDIVLSVITPFKDMFDVFLTTFDDLKIAFDPLIKIFDEVMELIFGVGKNTKFLSKIFNVLTPTLKMLAQVIGFIIHGALIPLSLTLKAFYFAIKPIMTVLKPILEVVSGTFVMFVDSIKQFINWVVELYNMVKGYTKTGTKAATGAALGVLGPTGLAAGLALDLTDNKSATQKTEDKTLEIKNKTVGVQDVNNGTAQNLNPLENKTVTPVPIMASNDIHTKIRKEAAATEAAISKVDSPELAKIADAANEETKLQTEMVNLLTTLVNTLQSKSNAGNSDANTGDTVANTIRQKAHLNSRWPTGNTFQTGGKNVLNLGPGIMNS